LAAWLDEPVELAMVESDGESSGSAGGGGGASCHYCANLDWYGVSVGCAACDKPHIACRRPHLFI
jgi:hypothetical protein